MTSGDPWVLVPLGCLIGGAFAVYLIARLIASRDDTLRNAILASFSAAIFAAALAALLVLGRRTGTAAARWGCTELGGACLHAGKGGLYVSGIAAALGVLVALYSARYLALDRRYRTYYPLLLLMTAGLVGMVMSADLFSLYLFCELMSLCAYVLVAFRRQTDTAVEAGYKYLMIGSTGTLTLLLGISFIYRETGVLSLPNPIAAPGPWARAGMACLLVGLAIKSALVPAHMWLPDAHGRAPSSVSAMLSGIIIQGGFYTMVSTSLGLGFPPRYLGALLMALGAANMTVGNGLALRQVHTKRLLAYSTVAQMGYVLFSVGVGLRYGIPGAVGAGFFLLLAHAAMKALAFLSKGVCHFYLGTTLVSELRGTSRRLPLVAATFSIALVGLVGVPPLAGFAGKWLVLSSLLRSGVRSGGWVVYAGMGLFLLNTLVSLGYYVPVIATLFAPVAEKDPTARLPVAIWMVVPLVALALLVLAIGLAPAPWLRWSEGLLGF